jgi:L-asparaginase / beta-aspartyl-peptidase
MPMWRAVRHGGSAGLAIAHRDADAVRAACERAYDVLAAGGAALDAAEAAVALMETDPTFDAGCGSFLTRDGEVEMDAIIATDSWRVASVCSLRNIEHPVHVARRLLETNKEVLLVGQGAYKFAIEHGFPHVPTESLLCGRELER